MSIIKRNNVYLSSFLNDFLNPDWQGGTTNQESRNPPVNIVENDINFELEFAVPGREKKDFNIEIDKSILSISVKPEAASNELEKNFTQKEFKLDSFSRSFNLPDSVSEDEIEASYINGILKLKLPKKEEALPKEKRKVALV